MEMFDVYPLYDIAIVKGRGSRVWDDKGTEYLDMYGGHAVISIGHSEPEYVSALKGQLDEIGFYSNSVVIKRQRELAELMGRLTGKPEYRLFLVSTGAEANENAMKLASFHTGRSVIVAFSGSFHGRTSLAVAATDNPSIVAPVNRTDNVVFLPFNDTVALRGYFAANGKSVAGVIVEGIQGVAGIKPATDEFLGAIRELCDEYGAVFIADSVQCGCGRTGTYFSHDAAGVSADIYTMAKGIGNGFPVGALAISPRFEAVKGMLGTTFGGSYLACAAAVAVCRVMLRDDLMTRAAQTGDYLLERLKKVPHVKEVRGRGLMIGIEFEFDSAPLRNELLMDEKIFVGAAGKYTVRLLPALNVNRADADRTVEALKKLAAKHGGR